MELRTLQYFLAVAREKNITHATQKLNMAQPPLSRQLQQLEEELGGPLFIRGKRKLQLTQEGEYLVQQAEAILNLATLTKEHVLEMRENTMKGMLSICATETCSSSIFPEIIPHFQSQFPQIRYDIWCGSSNDVCDRVEQGISDIGFLRSPFHNSNLESVSLKTEPWIAVVSHEHPLGSLKSVTLKDLYQYPLMIPSGEPLQGEIRHWISDGHYSLQILCLYNQVSSILPLISQNIGIAICPESVKRDPSSQNYVYLEIADKPYISELYMIRKRNQVLPPTAKVFWEWVKDI